VEPTWTFEFGGPTGYVDCGTGVAFDGAGNLILGAYSEPDMSWIRKYDLDYVERWTVGGRSAGDAVALVEDRHRGARRWVVQRALERFEGGIPEGTRRWVAVEK